MALDKLKTDMITDGTIVDADVSGIASSKLTGALPAISGTNLTSLPAANLTGTLPAISGANLTGVATDVTSIRQDILTLALHSAVTDNKVSHNLPFAFIDQFEDNSGILTETTVDRDSSGEYVATTQTAGSAGAYTSDSNTLILLHMDGSNDSTTFTDSSSHNRTVTRTNVNGTQPDLDTGTKKYGTASAYFGAHSGAVGHHGNALSLADHADWNFQANAFTIECWLYLNALPSGSNGRMELAGQSISSSSDVGGAWGWGIHNTSGGVRFNTYQRNGSNTSDDITMSSSSNVSTGAWTHLALTRDGNTIRMYLGGVQTATLAVPSNNSYALMAPNLGGDWWISRRSYNNQYGYISGFLDEYRISNNCRYPSGTSFTPNPPGTFNAAGTLISNVQTAPAATTSLSGVVLYTDNEGTATLGTDLIISMCADGSNFIEASSYGTAQTFSGSIKMVRLGKTTVASGTQVKLKAVWANQAAGSKETRLNGWAINY